MRALATAAVRDAANGPRFLEQAERAIGGPIQLLSGAREARLAALGVLSSIHQPDGVVGDLGGGSLELTDIREGRDRRRRDFAARRALPDGHFRALAQKGRENCARRARQGRGAAVSFRSNLLCRGRHMARAGAPAHAPAPISHAHHAQLRHPVPRRPRIRQTGRADRSRRPVLDRERIVRAPAAIGLWRRGAGGGHSPGQSARDRDLGVGGARGASVREPLARGSGEGPVDRRSPASSIA